ncbi:DUF2092 domain-containing protein [Inquilinus sp. Marseille-Q2685]|uniref:DUF2092 domain-containing protein n=1 Tax=Inquilinus sp. Marseille-Q2685 TaxID=2866581 RepID=UPI001CE428E2|nr:DUF2092 domain-containing protein [Inquilinus sp. Marseille-Q2685]
MDHRAYSISARHSRGRLAALAIAVLTLSASVVLPVQAQDDDAAAILRAMADYVTSQKTLSITFDADIEVITPQLEKIQFTSSGEALLSRPDKLRMRRTGGYADVEQSFDGKTLTVYGRSINAFAQLDTPGTVDQLIDRLRTEYSVSAPGADLLLSRVYDELMADVIEAKHIGQGVIDGIECEHLAFRNQDTDWQLWVEIGARPIPRKLVITSKAIAAAPQYTLRIKTWKTDVPAEAEQFALDLPPDAKKIGMDALEHLDEVPPGAATGGQP